MITQENNDIEFSTLAMTKGRPTATSTAPMIHTNKVADKILASDIVIPALMRNMSSPTLNSSWPIIILTRLFRYMIRAVSANVSTNEILVMPAQLVRLDRANQRARSWPVNYLVI